MSPTQSKQTLDGDEKGVCGTGARRKRVALEMEVRRSRWFVRGKEDKWLKGCVDADLDASPVTNTLQ